MRRSRRILFRPRSAFTLIELLLVIAIVAVLATAGFGVGHVMVGKSKAVQARAELAALSAALEGYKQAFGDYPRTTSNAELLQSLLGKRGPTGVNLTSHGFLDTTRVSLTDDPFAITTAECLDPWGQPYRYAYRRDNPWTHPGFLLYSSGPDATSAALLTGGEWDDSSPVNVDDIRLER
jgi:prepilin-type N-terminal cleavage/methylation domain-containing protein